MTKVRNRRIVLSCLLPVLFVGCESRAAPPRLDPALQATLTAWIADHGKGPTDYVVGLFDKHDVVFLGENHYVKHDVLFVQTLFKPLYRAGVRTLATEFARREDQSRVDSLLAAPEWDEGLARAIVFDQFVLWGYQEYVDLFRAAWELNHGLEPGMPRFRILGVNDSPDWSLIRDRKDLEDDAVNAKVWRGGGERYWADVILGAVSEGHKVLVYSGSHHAFTGYRQPVVAGGKFVRFDDTRMGNYVYRAIGKRAVTVFLHAPWHGVKGYDDDWVYPADGYIDALMLGLSSGPHPVGFDLADSPFGNLRIENAVYANGYDDFRLSMFCDGWIYTKPISGYEGVSPIRDWINPDNVTRARLKLPNPDWRTYTPQQINAMIASVADLGRMWGQLR